MGTTTYLAGTAGIAAGLVCMRSRLGQRARVGRQTSASRSPARDAFPARPIRPYHRPARKVRGRTFHDQTNRAGQHPAQAAHGPDHAGGRRDPELPRPLDALDRQPADPAGTRAVDRRHGAAAVGLPVGLCVRPAARRRAGRSRRPAPAAGGRAGAVVARPGRGRVRHLVRAVLHRPRVPRSGRGADVLLRRPGRAGLVQRPRPRPADRDMELHVVARAGASRRRY